MYGLTLTGDIVQRIFKLQLGYPVNVSDSSTVSKEYPKEIKFRIKWFHNTDLWILHSPELFYSKCFLHIVNTECPIHNLILLQPQSSLHHTATAKKSVCTLMQYNTA